MISETTLNHSLEPVKTIKINPSVSTVTVSNTLARFYVKIRFRFRVKPGVLHKTGACRKCAVNKVTYNYRGGRKRSFRTSNRKERLILIDPRTGYPTKTTFLYFNHISVTFFSWKLLEILENHLTFSSKNYGFSLMSSHRSWSSHRNHSSGLWFCYKLMDFHKKSSASHVYIIKYILLRYCHIEKGIFRECFLWFHAWFMRYSIQNALCWRKLWKNWSLTTQGGRVFKHNTDRTDFSQKSFQKNPRNQVYFE